MIIDTVKTKAQNAIKRRNATLENMQTNSLHFWLATWFKSGVITPMSGTWGTLFSMPLVYIVYMLFGFAGIAIASLVIFFIGLWAANKFEKESKTHDNSMIVIDETAGVLVGALALNGTLLSFILLFFLFRFFDVIKPWPIGWLDKKVDGGFGVMIDDVIAGLFTAIALWGIHEYIS